MLQLSFCILVPACLTLIGFLRPPTRRPLPTCPLPTCPLPTCPLPTCPLPTCPLPTCPLPTCPLLLRTFAAPLDTIFRPGTASCPTSEVFLSGRRLCSPCPVRAPQPLTLRPTTCSQLSALSTFIHIHVSANKLK
uniref:Uncharacterized protein n=1 Tax=Periophthalmus magnuspinnatus TaxID=409849 RepID=A0A3B4A2L6_9GOBI